MKISKVLGYAALIAWSFFALQGAAQPSISQTLRNIGATPLGLAPETALFNRPQDIRQFATMLRTKKEIVPAIEEYARTNNLFSPRTTSIALANTLHEIGATTRFDDNVTLAIRDTGGLKQFAQEYQKINGDLANNMWNGTSFQRKSVETPRSSRTPGAFAESICFLPEGVPPTRSTSAQQPPSLPSSSTAPSPSPKPLPASLSVPSLSSTSMRSPQPLSMSPAPSSISSSTSSRTHTVKPPLNLHDFISNIERYDTEIKNYQNRPMVKTYIMNSVPQRSVVFFLPSNFWLPTNPASRAALTRLVQVVVAELLNANKITSSITEEDKNIIAATLGFVCCGLDEHNSLETALQISMGSTLLGQQAAKPTRSSSSSGPVVERVVPDEVFNKAALQALNTPANLELLDAQRDDIEAISEGQPERIMTYYEATVQRADNPYLLLLQVFFKTLKVNPIILGYGKAGSQSVRMLALIAVVATHQTQFPRTQEMITSQDFVTACAKNFEALLTSILAGSSCAAAVQKVFPSLTGI